MTPSNTKAPLRAKTPKVIFLNRFFFPDHSATSQVLTDLTFALEAGRLDIHVITSRQRYDDPSVRLPPSEQIRSVTVHRCTTTHFGRSGLVGRFVDYATFYCAAALALWRLARGGDIVVAKTDPPMLSIIAWPIVRLRRAHLVNWLQDVFPEVLQVIGGTQGRLRRWAVGLIAWLRDRSLRKADINVVIGERMQAYVVARGLPPALTRLIPNSADCTLLQPVDAAQNALRAEWGLSDAFVVGYSGNLGRVHDFQTFLDAIDEVERAPADAGRRRIVWLFIGGGAGLNMLRQEVTRRRYASVEFKSYQPRARLSESLSAADVHLVSLMPELEGLVVPSKFYGIAACARPTVFVGDHDGEIGRILARDDSGLTVAPNDGSGLAKVILALAQNPERVSRLGDNARSAAQQRHDFRHAVAAWQRLLDELSNRREPPADEPPRSGRS